MTWIKVFAFGVALAIVTACTSPSPGRSSSTNQASSPAPCPSNHPVQRFPTSTPSNRNLELVWLKGSQTFYVRDITDILNPATLSKVEHVGFSAQFVSSTDVSYFDDKGIVRMPLAGSPRAAVACVQAFAVAWSPDGTSAAYITGTDASGRSELHLVGDGANRLLASLTGGVVTGCESPECSERTYAHLSFSPDGTHISYVQSWGGPVFRLWTSDGRLLKSIDTGATLSGNPSMSVWSGNSLYWRDEKGIEMWRDGTETLLIPDLVWIGPSAAPGGGKIVYWARDASGKPSVSLLDTDTGKVRELSKMRSAPVFLNSHLIWYREERTCVPSDPYPCPNHSTIPSGRTLIYDLADNTEIESVIAAVFDVWPHAA